VVLGGGVSRAGQPLLEGAKKYFDQYIFHASRSIQFALASLGNDAGAYGAFKLVLDEFG
jgi:glucokinase